MIRRFPPAFLLLAVLVLPAAWAQTQGRVEGRVLDAEGRPLEKVDVVIVAQWTTSVHYELTTDKNGKFRQIGMTPGDYQVR